MGQIKRKHYTRADIWSTFLTLSDRLSDVSLLEPGDLLHFPVLCHLPFDTIISMKLSAVQTFKINISYIKLNCMSGESKIRHFRTR